MEAVPNHFHGFEHNYGLAAVLKVDFSQKIFGFLPK
jgi:hypothetical protein